MTHWLTVKLRAWTVKMETARLVRESKRIEEKHRREHELSINVKLWRDDLRKNFGVTFINPHHSTSTDDRYLEATLFFKTMAGDIHRLTVNINGGIDIHRV